MDGQLRSTGKRWSDHVEFIKLIVSYYYIRVTADHPSLLQQQPKQPTMPRGIKWDDLPNNFVPSMPKQSKAKVEEQPTGQTHELNVINDSIAIGKRFSLGVIVSPCVWLC
jgi:hypothetical protein